MRRDKIIVMLLFLFVVFMIFFIFSPEISAFFSGLE